MSRMQRIDDDFYDVLKFMKEKSGVPLTTITKKITQDLKEGRYTPEFFRSKKGNAPAAIVIVGLVFVVLLFTIMPVMSVLNNFNDQMQTIPNAGSTAQAVTQNATDNYAPMYDGIAGLFLVLLTVALLASVFIINTYAIFFVFMLVIYIFTFVFFAIMNNVMDQYANNPLWANLYSQYTIIPFIIDHYLAIMLGIGLVGLMIMFAKVKVST